MTDKTTQKPKGDKTVVVHGLRAVKRNGAITFDLRLSDPEMKPQMDALKADIRRDPEIGRQLMIDAGIWTPSGNLSRRFGGR